MKTNNQILCHMRKWLLFVAAGSLLWYSCSNVTGGGEIGNPITITGKVVNARSWSKSAMRIYLLNTDAYNPVTASLGSTTGKPYEMTHPLAETVTDSNGEYSISVTFGRGAYHIFGLNADSSVMMYHKIASPNSILDTPFIDTAVAPGAVIVGITDSDFVPKGYIYVKGTLLFAKVDSIGRTIIRCPAGAVSLAYYSAVSDSVLTTIPPIGVSNVPGGISIEGSMVVDLSSLMHRISKPRQPAGGTVVSLSSQGTGTPYSTGMSSSNLNDTVQYRFSWGDNSSSPWSVAAGAMMTYYKQWPSAGTYTVRAQARSIKDTTVVSVLSDPLTVTVAQ
jgi:hypothetical protein